MCLGCSRTQLVLSRHRCLAGDYIAAWWQRAAIHQLPLFELGEEYLLEWVKADPEMRAPRLATVLGAPHAQVSNLHATLLREYGETGVEAAFYSEFMSGMFWGNESAWLEGKLSQALEWSKDPRPEVRDFAKGLMSHLRPRIRSAQAQEAEEQISE